MAVNRRKVLQTLVGLGAGAVAGAAFGQAAKPIRIGFSIAHTGPLSGAGKSGLVALQLWRDDVNARGGLLGRPVELVVYDDQSSPALTPGIYAKLLDVDRVDLLIAPYGTNPTAPILPLVKQRDRLIIGNFALDANTRIRHDKYFTNQPWASARAATAPWLEVAVKLGVKSVAILAADAEFAQNLAGGLRDSMAAQGLQLVFDQNYPPATVDFTSPLRSIRSKRADAVFVAAYPPDASAIIRALNEVGVGSTVKLFGGGMVGLQYASVLESLGSMLNGVINYHVWVPEPTMNFPGIADFITRYRPRARAANVDPLGFYLPPFDYAIGQILAQAISATRSLDNKVLANYLRNNEMQTIVGNFRYDAVGEWVTPRMVYVQFRNLADKNLEQFYAAGKQVIVAPARFRTAEPIPFNQARG